MQIFTEVAVSKIYYILWFFKGWWGTRTYRTRKGYFSTQDLARTLKNYKDHFCELKTKQSSQLILFWVYDYFEYCIERLYRKGSSKYSLVAAGENTHIEAPQKMTSSYSFLFFQDGWCPFPVKEGGLLLLGANSPKKELAQLQSELFSPSVRSMVPPR